jgi:hypothetical protein
MNAPEMLTGASIGSADVALPGLQSHREADERSTGTGSPALSLRWIFEPVTPSLTVVGG